MIRRPPRSTRTTHSFPTRRSSDLIACLVDEHLRFVLKLPHLVVDLLQRADRGQRVLDQVGRVNHRPLRLRGRQRAEQSGSDGRKKCLLHDGFSCGGLEAAGADGSRSAAQSRPQWRSQAAAKLEDDADASTASMSRWSCGVERSEEHTSELQSLMRISYAVFCLKKKKYTQMQN